MKKDINYEELFQIVSDFREAIVEAKNNYEFDRRDRMSNFPGGCCDDACDLLGYHLYNNYEIKTKQGNGVYEDDDPENTTNHAWLVMENGTVIDITGTQFRSCAGFFEEVYIAKENSFYNGLRDKRCDENFNIENDSRLWNDYKIIKEYLRYLR